MVFVFILLLQCSEAIQLAYWNERKLWAIIKSVVCYYFNRQPMVDVYCSMRSSCNLRFLLFSTEIGFLFTFPFECGLLICSSSRIARFNIVHISFNLYISSPENCQIFNNRLVCRKILLLLAIMRASNGRDKCACGVFGGLLGGLSVTTSKTIHELLSALLLCGLLFFCTI